MDNVISSFFTGIVYICLTVMQGIGAVDDLASRGMELYGLDPRWQLYVVLVVTAVLVVLALRVVGGLLGWLVLMVLVLFLMHRIVPNETPPSMSPLIGSLQRAF